MTMLAQMQRVSVRLVCRRCRYTFELCVAVSAAVPGPLRCTPAGGPAVGSGSSTGLGCPKCQCPCGMSDSDLRRRVEDELRYARGRHVTAGAVVIEYG